LFSSFAHLEFGSNIQFWNQFGINLIWLQEKFYCTWYRWKFGFFVSKIHCLVFSAKKNCQPHELVDFIAG